MLQRLLLVWLCLLSMVAYGWPAWFGTAADPFFAGRPLLKPLFAVTMFAIGWMLPQDEIRQVARRWPTVLGGTAAQYLAMPLLGWGMGRLFQVGDDLMIGMVLVGCVPGAMASNVLTLVARGNVSYSVGLTTLATLLSPLVVPLGIRLALGRVIEMSFWEQSADLCLLVVLPVVAGHLLGQCLPAWEAVARRVGSAVANLAILWIIATVVALSREKLAQLQPVIFWALLAVNGLGYLAGYAAGRLMRLPDTMRRALTLEVGMQNAGLGALLATEWFAHAPAAAIPPALYTFGCMFTGTLLAHLWARWPASDTESPAAVS